MREELDDARGGLRATKRGTAFSAKSWGGELRAGEGEESDSGLTYQDGNASPQCHRERSTRAARSGSIAAEDRNKLEQDELKLKKLKKDGNRDELKKRTREGDAGGGAGRVPREIARVGPPERMASKHPKLAKL